MNQIIILDAKITNPFCQMHGNSSEVIYGTLFFISKGSCIRKYTIGPEFDEVH